MKKMVLLAMVVSSVYARYDYDYSCDALYSDYKGAYSNVNASSLHYGYSYGYRTYCKTLGEKLDRSNFSSAEEEAHANAEYLKHKKRTYGVACAQIQKNIPVYYKKEYCDIVQSIDDQESGQSRVRVSTPTPQPVQRAPIDPAVQYKKAPQLKIGALKMYGVKDIKPFRDQTETLMVESATGNFALPKNDLINAEKINFTPELSVKFQTLLR